LIAPRVVSRVIKEPLVEQAHLKEEHKTAHDDQTSGEKRAGRIKANKVKDGGLGDRAEKM